MAQIFAEEYQFRLDMQSFIVYENYYINVRDYVSLSSLPVSCVENIFKNVAFFSKEEKKFDNRHESSVWQFNEAR